MAWTATTGASYQIGGQVATLVHLDNGTETFTERFLNNGTGPSLKRAVLAWISARDVVTNALKCVPPDQTITLDPDAPAVPTQAELDRATFMQSWRTFCNYDNAVNAGLILATNANYVAAKADVLARYQASYLDLLETI